MKMILMLIALMLSAPMLANEWKYYSDIDEFTDEKTERVTYNDGKYQLQFTRVDDGSIWMYIRVLGLELFDTQQILETRVDKEEMEEYDLREPIRWGVQMSSWDPRVVGMRIFHGQMDKISGSIGCGKVLKEVYEGEQLAVRYVTTRSSRRTFRIPLTGIADALDMWLPECFSD